MLRESEDFLVHLVLQGLDSKFLLFSLEVQFLDLGLVGVLHLLVVVLVLLDDSLLLLVPLLALPQLSLPTRQLLLS